MAVKQRWAPMRLGGRVSGLSMKERVEQWSIPEPNTGCWLWVGSMTPVGYGLLTVHDPDKRIVGAHRASYEAHVGPIPRGLVLDHKCCTPACVNPDHLRPVTKAFNTLIGTSKSAENARKTHCIRGHELRGANLRPGIAGRRCVPCERARYRERKEAQP